MIEIQKEITNMTNTENPITACPLCGGTGNSRSNTSFANTPAGKCPECKGAGTVTDYAALVMANGRYETAEETLAGEGFGAIYILDIYNGMGVESEPERTVWAQDDEHAIELCQRRAERKWDNIVRCSPADDGIISFGPGGGDSYVTLRRIE